METSEAIAAVAAAVQQVTGSNPPVNPPFSAQPSSDAIAAAVQPVTGSNTSPPRNPSVPTTPQQPRLPSEALAPNPADLTPSRLFRLSLSPPSPLTPIPQQISLPRESSPSPHPDLVTAILGVQVDAVSETVRWTSGQVTVLPYLEDDDEVKNILHADQAYVEQLAKLPECTPSSQLVVFLENTMAKSDLLKAAREALSNNKTVVVRRFMDVSGLEFTVESLDESFMTFPDSKLQVHGA